MYTFLKTILYAFWWGITSIIRPFASQQSVPVLMYHSFDTKGWRYGVDPKELERQIAYIMQHYTVVPLLDVVSFARGEKMLPKNAVAITVDDGYEDTYTELFPLAKKYSIPFTVFLTTDLSQQEKLGNLKRPSWDQIQEMHQSGLVTIEVHGRHHSNFPDISDDEQKLREEIDGCREDIQSKLSYTSNIIAYPAGRRNSDVIEYVAKQGFQAGFLAREGHVRRGMNIFELPRVQVDRTIPLFQFKARLTPALGLHVKMMSLLRS